MLMLFIQFVSNPHKLFASYDLEYITQLLTSMLWVFRLNSLKTLTLIIANQKNHLKVKNGEGFTKKHLLFGDAVKRWPI